MSTSTDILTGVQFASYKHRNQRRKNKKRTPYINHPIAVAHLLRTVAGVTDSPTLIAALLHDTLEDTETTRKELFTTFGGVEILELVEEVTDDKTLKKSARKQGQIDHAPKLSYRAKMIKLADLTCNLTDILDDPPPSWSKERRGDYLVWTERVIEGCRGTNEKLEQYYDQLVTRGRRKLPGACLRPPV